MERTVKHFRSLRLWPFVPRARHPRALSYYIPATFSAALNFAVKIRPIEVYRSGAAMRREGLFKTGRKDFSLGSLSNRSAKFS